MKIRITLLLSILLVGSFSAVAVNGQNKGLILRGTYSEWERKFDHSYSNDGWEFKKTDKEIVLWTAKLRMEFVNKGREPIILICPNQECRKWQSKIYFSTRRLNDSGEFVKYSFLKDTKDYYQRGSTRGLARDLNTSDPPPYLTVIIKPGDSMIFDDTLYIEQAFNKKEIDGSVHKILEGPASEISFADGEKGIPISAYEEVKVKYELSFLDVVKDPDFMEKLQAKWRKYGYLPVDSEGKFSITSEVLKKG